MIESLITAPLEVMCRFYAALNSLTARRPKRQQRLLTMPSIHCCIIWEHPYIYRIDEEIL